MRLRCHLGILIPEGCGMKVGGVECTWETGRCIVFDDNFVHEVWNLSDFRRIVLRVDFWHPDLTDEEVELLNGLQRYAASHGMNLKKYWERNEKSRAKAAASSDSLSVPTSGIESRSPAY